MGEFNTTATTSLQLQSCEGALFKGKKEKTKWKETCAFSSHYGATATSVPQKGSNSSPLQSCSVNSHPCSQKEFCGSPAAIDCMVVMMLGIQVEREAGMTASSCCSSPMAHCQYVSVCCSNQSTELLIVSLSLSLSLTEINHRYNWHVLLCAQCVSEK